MSRRKRYSTEFKRQALRRADEPGVTDALVCEELGISARQLRRWRDAVAEHGGESAFPGHGKSRDEELTRLEARTREGHGGARFFKRSGEVLSEESK